MPKSRPGDVESAMTANAASRVSQAAASDELKRNPADAAPATKTERKPRGKASGKAH